jgi:hypothetical protein
MLVYIIKKRGKNHRMSASGALSSPLRAPAVWLAGSAAPAQTRAGEVAAELMLASSEADTGVHFSLRLAGGITNSSSGSSGGGGADGSAVQEQPLLAAVPMEEDDAGGEGSMTAVAAGVDDDDDAEVSFRPRDYRPSSQAPTLPSTQTDVLTTPRTVRGSSLPSSPVAPTPHVLLSPGVIERTPDRAAPSPSKLAVLPLVYSNDDDDDDDDDDTPVTKRARAASPVPPAAPTLLLFGSGLVPVPTPLPVPTSMPVPTPIPVPMPVPVHVAGGADEDDDDLPSLPAAVALSASAAQAPHTPVPDDASGDEDEEDDEEREGGPGEVQAPTPTPQSGGSAESNSSARARRATKRVDRLSPSVRSPCACAPARPIPTLMDTNMNAPSSPPLAQKTLRNQGGRDAALSSATRRFLKITEAVKRRSWAHIAADLEATRADVRGVASCVWGWSCVCLARRATKRCGVGAAGG